MAPTGKIYTPTKTRDFERRVANEWTAKHGDDPFDGPVGVKVHATADWLNIMVWELDQKYDLKPRGDLDNYVKIALDAINGVAWSDDRHVMELVAQKGVVLL